MNKKDGIKKIGILTSGGDAPGMNAVVRAVVRTAVNNGIKVTGIKRGYEGLLAGDIMDMDSGSVSEIIHKGGTVLLSARCPEMHEKKYQERIADICKVLGFDALVVVGGDGSLQGAIALADLGINVVGIPGTIDMDLPYTDYTIGFDTAVNTAMEAINKIKDTTSSHERCSVVEVMGRNCGNIALWCSIDCGAEEVLIPENPIPVEDVIEVVIKNRAKGKSHNLIIVAEGVGGSQELAERIEATTAIETRTTILGYLQRGGSPTSMDRKHGSMMGYYAVKALLNGEKNIAIGYNGSGYKTHDIYEALAVERNDDYNTTMYNVIKMLSV